MSLAAPPPEARRRTGAARAIRWLLALQIAIALLLTGGDLLRVAPDLFAGDAANPGLGDPVSPGDQTRRFAPPMRPGFPGFPGEVPPPRRLTWEPAATPAGDGLRLTGEIRPGDAGRFAAFLDGRAEPLAAVTLHSPGGSVADAMAIGRRLRADGIATRVGADDACLSACPYILAGGATRTVSRAAMVGVHQHFFGRSTVLPAFVAVEDIQRGQSEVMGFLEEMGVDLRLVTKAMATPPHDIYVLVEQELADFALATEMTD